MSDQFSEQDLREATEFIERRLKDKIAMHAWINSLAAEFARIRSEARAGMREACAAKICSHCAKGVPALPSETGSGIWWHGDDIYCEASKIRKLPDLAADEAIERQITIERDLRDEHWTRALGFTGILTPNVAALKIGSVKAAARLEEHRRECVIWKFVTNNPCEAPQTCERCAALERKETEHVR